MMMMMMMMMKSGLYDSRITLRQSALKSYHF